MLHIYEQNVPTMETYMTRVVNPSMETGFYRDYGDISCWWNKTSLLIAISIIIWWFVLSFSVICIITSRIASTSRAPLEFIEGFRVAHPFSCLCCVVLYTRPCQYHRITHSCLSIRFSLTFIQTLCRKYRHNILQ